MHLFTSINNYASTEWPNQLNDLYWQINGIILTVKKMGIPSFCFPFYDKKLI